MGQVLRRTARRLPGSGNTRPPPPPPADLSRNPERRPPPPQDGAVAVQDRLGVSSPEDTSEMHVENNVLEEHDPQFDVMLQKMVGTIKSKPGGKPEMGEAFIVQKYTRPLPKVRSSKEESGGHGQKPAHPGTLTIAQLQEILLLYQGNSTDRNGPMEIQDIAKKMGVDAAQVEKIIMSVSLPPEDKNKDTKE